MLIVHTLPADTHAKPRSTASVESYRAHRLGGFTKTTFPFSRHRKFLGKKCVAALDGVFRCRYRLQQMWFSSAIQGIPLKKVCRCMNVPENSVSPFTTQVILRKMVCRCSEGRVGVWFLSAIQGISRKRVCRGECKGGKGSGPS